MRARRPRYSKDLKQSIVQKISTPGGPSVVEMAEKTGVHPTSIYGWLKVHANPSNMQKLNEWTAQKKLLAIVETFSMNENQLGEFLRSSGLHSSDLEEWKQEFYSSQRSPGRPKVDPEVVALRAKEKELSSDLLRKDRALAEMSARIILLKKSHVLFGGNEDDE